MLLQIVGRNVRRQVFAGGGLSPHTRHRGGCNGRRCRRLPRRWNSESARKPSAGPQEQLTVTRAELEAVVERAVGRIAADVARNTARIKEQGKLVAANTESRLSTERRLWNEALMEEKIEKVHDVLVREEARVQQWVDLGITGIKSQTWNRYSIGVACAIVALLVVFKRQIYDRIGKEAAELTGAAISDPKLVDRVQQLIVAIGKSPETVAALTDLLKKVFAERIVLNSCVDLTAQLLANDATRQSLQTLLVERVFRAAMVRQAAGEFVIGALEEEETKAALQELIKELVHDLLRDERTHYEAAAASKSTLGRTFWLNREPQREDLDNDADGQKTTTSLVHSETDSGGSAKKASKASAAAD